VPGHKGGGRRGKEPRAPPLPIFRRWEQSTEHQGFLRKNAYPDAEEERPKKREQGVDRSGGLLFKLR